MARNFRDRFGNQFGKTDFTNRALNDDGEVVEQPPTRTPGKDTNKLRRSKRSAVIGTDAERKAEVAQRTRDDKYQPSTFFGLGRGALGGGKAMGQAPEPEADAVEDFETAPGTGVATMRDRTVRIGNNSPTPNVNTISSESFVGGGGAYTGFVSPEQQRQREAGVRRDIEQERLDEARQSDMEWRRGLRQRRLLDEANLSLGSNLSLGELADRASRRRAARQTLRQQDVTAAERDIAAAQNQQELAIEMMKERGRDRRALLDEQSELSDREKELFDRNLSSLERLSTYTNDDGEQVVNQQAVQNALGFISGSGDKLANLSQAEVNKYVQFGQLANNITNASGGEFVPENLSELVGIVGAVDENLLPDLLGQLGEVLDPDTVELLDEQGKEARDVALNRIANQPKLRRSLEEIINSKVIRGDLINARVKPFPMSLFQEPDDISGLRNRRGVQLQTVR